MKTFFILIPLHILKVIFELSYHATDLLLPLFPIIDFLLPDPQAGSYIRNHKLEIILNLLTVVVVPNVFLDNFAGYAQFGQNNLSFGGHGALVKFDPPRLIFATLLPYISSCPVGTFTADGGGHYDLSAVEQLFLDFRHKLVGIDSLHGVINNSACRYDVSAAALLVHSAGLEHGLNHFAGSLVEVPVVKAHHRFAVVISNVDVSGFRLATC